jgi:hypothetical protein
MQPELGAPGQLTLAGESRISQIGGAPLSTGVASPRRQIIPKSGMIVPEMGRKAIRGSLADALFTAVQQRVLGLLFGQPERRFQSAELIRLAKGGIGAVHRQLARLAAVGLVTVMRSGNQKHYRANRESPVFTELHGLIVKTVGVAEPLRQALKAKAGEIREAEAVLARTVNPTVLTVAEWRAKRARKDSFVSRVAAQPKLFVIGSDDDLV